MRTPEGRAHLLFRRRIKAFKASAADSVLSGTAKLLHYATEIDRPSAPVHVGRRHLRRRLGKQPNLRYEEFHNASVRPSCRGTALAASLPCLALPAAAADLYEPPYEDPATARVPRRRTAMPTYRTISSRPYPPPGLRRPRRLRAARRCARPSAGRRLARLPCSRAARWRRARQGAPSIGPAVRADHRPLLGRGRRRPAHLRRRYGGFAGGPRRYLAARLLLKAS